MTIYFEVRFLFLPKLHLMRCLLLAGLCSILACKEPPPTVIQGAVVNSKTGAPIAGAVGLLQFHIENGSNGEVLDTKKFSTDELGRFQFSYSSDYSYIAPSFIQKDGFISHYYLDIKKESVNDFDIHLIPTDAVLRVNIKNASGLHNTIFAAIFSPSYAKEHQSLYRYQTLEKFPLYLNQGEVYTEEILLPSDEYIKIYWDFINHPYPNFASSALSYDSIYTTSNSILEFTIDY